MPPPPRPSQSGPHEDKKRFQSRYNQYNPSYYAPASNSGHRNSSAGSRYNQMSRWSGSQNQQNPGDSSRYRPRPSSDHGWDSMRDSGRGNMRDNVRDNVRDSMRDQGRPNFNNYNRNSSGYYYDRKGDSYKNSRGGSHSRYNKFSRNNYSQGPSTGPLERSGSYQSQDSRASSQGSSGPSPADYGNDSYRRKPKRYEGISGEDMPMATKSFDNKHSLGSSLIDSLQNVDGDDDENHDKDNHIRPDHMETVKVDNNDDDDDDAYDYEDDEGGEEEADHLAQTENISTNPLKNEGSTKIPEEKVDNTKDDQTDEAIVGVESATIKTDLAVKKENEDTKAFELATSADAMDIDESNAGASDNDDYEPDVEGVDTQEVHVPNTILRKYRPPLHPVEGCIFPMNRVETALWELKNQPREDIIENQKYLLKNPVKKLAVYPFLAENLVIHAQAGRPSVLKALSAARKANYFKSLALRKEFQFRESLWLKKVDVLEKLSKDLHKESSKPDEVSRPILEERSTSRRRNRGDFVDDSEMENLLHQLDPIYKHTQLAAEIPEMILDPIERSAFIFKDVNNLVTDKEAWASRVVSDCVDNFTEAEQKAFTEAYLSFPKKFGKISAAMGGLRTSEECVLHYYRTKASVNYKKLLIEKNKRRKGGYRRKSRKEAEDGEDTGVDTTVLEEHEEPEIATAKVETESETEETKPEVKVKTEKKKEKKKSKKNDESDEDIAESLPETVEETQPNQILEAKNPPVEAETVVEPDVPTIAELVPSDSHDDGVSPDVVSSAVVSSNDEVSQEVISSKAVEEGEETEDEKPSASQRAEADETEDENKHEETEDEDKKRKHGDSEEGHPKKKARKDHSSKYTSYWSVQEANKFPELLQKYGTQWHLISTEIETKSVTMVRNYFQRKGGPVGWHELALKVDQERIGKEKEDWRSNQKQKLDTQPGNPPVGFFFPDKLNNLDEVKPQFSESQDTFTKSTPPLENVPAPSQPSIQLVSSPASTVTNTPQQHVSDSRGVTPPAPSNVVSPKPSAPLSRVLSSSKEVENKRSSIMAMLNSDDPPPSVMHMPPVRSTLNSILNNPEEEAPLVSPTSETSHHRVDSAAPVQAIVHEHSIPVQSILSEPSFALPPIGREPNAPLVSIARLVQAVEAPRAPSRDSPLPSFARTVDAPSVQLPVQPPIQPPRGIQLPHGVPSPQPSVPSPAPGSISPAAHPQNTPPPAIPPTVPPVPPNFSFSDPLAALAAIASADANNLLPKS